MKKQIIITLVAATLSLSILAGCGKSDEQPETEVSQESDSVMVEEPITESEKAEELSGNSSVLGMMERYEIGTDFDICPNENFSLDEFSATLSVLLPPQKYVSMPEETFVWGYINEEYTYADLNGVIYYYCIDIARYNQENFIKNLDHAEDLWESEQYYVTYNTDGTKYQYAKIPYDDITIVDKDTFIGLSISIGAGKAEKVEDADTNRLIQLKDDDLDVFREYSYAVYEDIVSQLQ